MAGRGGALPQRVRRVTDGRSKYRDAASGSRNLTSNGSRSWAR
ncbi:hypothetical protein [Streptomyces sp. yr375]